jgi:hypothetical protein
MLKIDFQLGYIVAFYVRSRLGAGYIIVTRGR